MYNLIFVVVYDWAMRHDKGEWLSKVHACNAMSFAFLVHISFVLEGLKFYFGLDVKQISILTNKNFMILIVIFVFLFAHLYYSKNRIKIIYNKYFITKKSKKFNGLKVAILIIIPLIIMIIIGGEK